MKALEEKIIREGIVKKGNILKVDSFLNHQIDVAFLDEMGKEFQTLFQKHPINKILTIEASGIGVAVMTATLRKNQNHQISLMNYIIQQ